MSPLVQHVCRTCASKLYLWRLMLFPLNYCFVEGPDQKIQDSSTESAVQGEAKKQPSVHVQVSSWHFFEVVIEKVK